MTNSLVGDHQVVVVDVNEVAVVDVDKGVLEGPDIYKIKECYCLSKNFEILLMPHLLGLTAQLLFKCIFYALADLQIQGDRVVRRKRDRLHVSISFISMHLCMDRPSIVFIERN